MVPLNGEYVDPSSVARSERVNQVRDGGRTSPAPRPPRRAAASLPEIAEAPQAPRPGRWQRLRESVWLPVLVKGGGAVAGLACLAFVGATALPGAPAGVPVTAVGTEWIAGEAPSDESAHEPTPALSGASPAAPSNPASNATSSASSGPSASAPSEPAPSSTVGAPCSSGASSESASGKGAGLTADGRVILNVASAEELTRLPGVGQRRAEQIVALRERLGRFKRVTDLLRVKGIGPKSLRRLTPLIVLDPPEPAPTES